LKAVPALTRGDGERLLRFVAEAESLGGDQPFTPELLGELGRLVEADSISYCELDRVRRRDLFYVQRAPDEEEDVDIDPAVFWDIVIEEDPICMAHQLGHYGAHKMSDFVTRQEFRNMRLYELWYGPFGTEYELNVALPSPLWHTKTFLLSRGPGRDFTERDRLVLDLLQPHLARLWEAAQTRRLLKAALARLDQSENGDSSGVILLAGAESGFTSPTARRLVRDFFQPGTGGRLPPELARWLEAGAERPFSRQRGERVLTVRREGDALLLQVKREEARLTRREREVLSWVARGKTNAQVAELLWLSPSTVRKHLENVYPKLGVNTRTAAVASFLGLIDAEAS
jgi:DNA-binding CsgD family transcriptional regulator